MSELREEILHRFELILSRGYSVLTVVRRGYSLVVDGVQRHTDERIRRDPRYPAFDLAEEAVRLAAEIRVAGEAGNAPGSGGWPTDLQQSLEAPPRRTTQEAVDVAREAVWELGTTLARAEGLSS